MIQFADQVNVKLISQLISGISRVLQKLIRWFNGNTISISTVLSIPVLFENLKLNLNDLESAKLSSGLSLQYCYEIPDVVE